MSLDDDDDGVLNQYKKEHNTHTSRIMMKSINMRRIKAEKKTPKK